MEFYKFDYEDYSLVLKIMPIPYQYKDNKFDVKVAVTKVKI